MLTEIWGLIKQYPESSIALGGLFVTILYFAKNRLKLLFFNNEQDAAEKYVDDTLREIVEKIYKAKTKLYKEQNNENKLSNEQIKEIRNLVKTMLKATIGDDMKEVVKKGIPDLDAYVEVNLDLIYDEFKLNISQSTEDKLNK